MEEPNNSLAHQILILMTSVMESCDKNKSIIKFFICFGENLLNTNIIIIKTIVIHYP